MKKYLVGLMVLVVSLQAAIIKHGIVQHEDCDPGPHNYPHLHDNPNAGTCTFNCCHQYNRCIDSAGDHKTVTAAECEAARAVCRARCNEHQQPILYKEHMNDR